MMPLPGMVLPVTHVPVALSIETISNPLPKDGVEIELRRRLWAMSVERKTGERPQFERTITAADLPARLRTAVEAVSAGAKHIVDEQVISPDRPGFEVSVRHETSKMTLNR